MSDCCSYNPLSNLHISNTTRIFIIIAINYLTPRSFFAITTNDHILHIHKRFIFFLFLLILGCPQVRLGQRVGSLDYFHLPGYGLSLILNIHRHKFRTSTTVTNFTTSPFAFIIFAASSSAFAILPASPPAFVMFALCHIQVIFTPTPTQTIGFHV